MSDEYPKVIYAGGIKVVVTSAEDEARWSPPVVAEDVPKAKTKAVAKKK